MDTITAILEPDADGTLHLPLPEGLRGGAVFVTATMEPVISQKSERRAGVWGKEGEFWMSPDFDEPLEEFREYME